MNDIENKSQQIIYAMLALAIFSWIVERVLPPFAHIRSLVVGVSLLTCFCLFPYRVIKSKDFDKGVRLMLRGLICVTVIAVCISVFSTEPVYFGNKWTTLFGNENCTYLMLAPLFMCLGCSLKNINTATHALFLYLLLSCWSVFVDGLALLPVIWVAGVIYPYVNKKYKALLLLALGESIYASIFRTGTARTQIIIIAIAVFTYLGPRLLPRKILKYVCYAMFFIPLICTMAMLIFPEFNALDAILSFVQNKTNDSDLSADSRSFLFYEMAEDLTKNNAWLLGKGASGTYYSAFFEKSDGDFHHRIISEVWLLQLLMRGGVVYASLYYGLFFHSIHNIFKKSQNRFLLSAAIMSSGWVLVSCFSAEMGTNFFHLLVYLLVGCGFSRTILSKSEKTIESEISFK